MDPCKKGDLVTPMIVLKVIDNCNRFLQSGEKKGEGLERKTLAVYFTLYKLLGIEIGSDAMVDIINVLMFEDIEMEDASFLDIVLLCWGWLFQADYLK